MADVLYNQFVEFMGDGSIDLDNDQFKAALIKNTHTPDATDTDFTDISGDELAAGSGYSAGGEILASVTWVESSGVITFDADDPLWASITFTGIRYLAIYDDTHASDLLVCLLDFGEDKSATAEPFQVVFNSNGIITFTKA